jgi:hypothetical protein
MFGGAFLFFGWPLPTSIPTSGEDTSPHEFLYYRNQTQKGSNTGLLIRKVQKEMNE